jgi:hypothetical protein
LIRYHEQNGEDGKDMNVEDKSENWVLRANNILNLIEGIRGKSEFFENIRKLLEKNQNTRKQNTFAKKIYKEILTIAREIMSPIEFATFKNSLGEQDDTDKVLLSAVIERGIILSTTEFKIILREVDEITARSTSKLATGDRHHIDQLNCMLADFERKNKAKQIDKR